MKQEEEWVGPSTARPDRPLWSHNRPRAAHETPHARACYWTLGRCVNIPRQRAVAANAEYRHKTSCDDIDLRPARSTAERVASRRIGSGRVSHLAVFRAARRATPIRSVHVFG